MYYIFIYLYICVLYIDTYEYIYVIDMYMYMFIYIYIYLYMLWATIASPATPRSVAPCRTRRIAAIGTRQWGHEDLTMCSK